MIIKKSKEDNKLVLFNGYEDDEECIVSTIQQQFYEAKPRKIFAVGRWGGGVFLLSKR